MDLSQFASDPSDPRWVKPGWKDQHLHRIVFHSHGRANHDHEGDGSGDKKHETPEPKVNTPQREALHDAAVKISALCCAKDRRVADVRDVFLKWEDAAGRIQPNALAWFSDTWAVRSACENNNQDLLRFLLEKGFQPDVDAVRPAALSGKDAGDYVCVRLLVEFGLDVNRPIQGDVASVLSFALNDMEFAQWLLSLGADPNATSPEGLTVMHTGVLYGRLNILQHLVEHGATVRGGNLVAHAAVMSDCNEARVMEIIQFLLDHGASIDAYYRDNYNESNMQLCRGFPVVDFVWGRQNALHIAIRNRSRDLVKLLLERGANKSLPGWSGVAPFEGQAMSPIEMARACGCEDIVELLESSETSVNAP